MSATIAQFPREAQARKEFHQSMDTLRLDIACAASVSEVYEIWRALVPIAAELNKLVDRAADRCLQLEIEGL